MLIMNSQGTLQPICDVVQLKTFFALLVHYSVFCSIKLKGIKVCALSADVSKYALVVDAKYVSL